MPNYRLLALSEDEPQDGDVAVYDATSGRWVPQAPPTTGGGTSNSQVYVGPDDPAGSVPTGSEYVWFKTDGNGTTLDILTGKAV